MDDRSIPPLKDFLPTSGPFDDDDNGNSTGSTKKHLVGETRLLHVTAIIRHGARTPWSSEMKCWDGYWDSPETGKWDCDDLTTFMAQPSRDGRGPDGQKWGENAEPEYDPDLSLFFEKKYDALSYPEDNLANVLNGTCQMGQLIQQGYGQQIQNGNILREAYTYREGEYDHDERMRLLNINIKDSDPFPWHHQLYFRADDYQRTVMSGQVLLRGMFDKELRSYHEEEQEHTLVIPLHIADEARDVLDPNERDCPRLRTIKAEAMASAEYQALNNSQSSQEIRDFMQSQLGMGDDASILDCFMCTLCTDRPLPQSVDDYDGSSRNWFTRLTEYEIQRHNIVMKHNGAEYAKLGMGPLWYEIMQHINHVIDEESAPKLALFAGHDTTLMPLLASLGPELWKDTEWAAYASMMVIEIHELIDGRSDPDIYTTNYAFRLLYNGKILTPLIEGCHEESELCDITHFKAIVDPIATRDTDCSVPNAPTGGQAPEAAPSSSSASSPDETTITNSVAQKLSFVSLSTTTGMIVFGTLVLLSGIGGSAITFSVLRRRTQYKSVVDFGGAWDIDDNNDGQYGLELTEGGAFRD